MLGEVFGEVEHVVRDVELRGHASGVLDVGDAAAPRVRVATPELQGHPGHLEAALEHQRSGNR